MSTERFEWRRLVIDLIPSEIPCPQGTICPDRTGKDSPPPDTHCDPPAESMTVLRGGISAEALREILGSMPERPLHLIVRPEPGQEEEYHIGGFQ